ncbi:MAG: hypothetical protein AB7H90_12060 [Alphaproteobacteria bacterium]
MRLALAGLLVAGGLITTLSLGWSGLGWGGAPSPESGVGEDAWQLRELIFLKTVYDRMQQDIASQAEASASLYAERQRILREMAETAKLLPSEAVPPGLRVLLRDADAAPASLSRLIETIEAEERSPDPPARPPPDLRVGLRVASGDEPLPVVRAAGLAPEFAIDPELREPIRSESAPKRTPRRKPRDASGSGER